MTTSEFIKKDQAHLSVYLTVVSSPETLPITAAHEPIPSATSTVIVFTVSMTSFPNSGDS